MDIVERLRVCANLDYPLSRSSQAMEFLEAAAEIERLRAELAARDGEIADWLRDLALTELANIEGASTDWLDGYRAAASRIKGHIGS